MVEENWHSMRDMRKRIVLAKVTIVEECNEGDIEGVYICRRRY
jgi:hypothetical protein